MSDAAILVAKPLISAAELPSRATGHAGSPIVYARGHIMPVNSRFALAARKMCEHDCGAMVQQRRPDGLIDYIIQPRPIAARPAPRMPLLPQRALALVTALVRDGSRMMIVRDLADELETSINRVLRAVRKLEGAGFVRFETWFSATGEPWRVAILPDGRTTMMPPPGFRRLRRKGEV